MFFQKEILWFSLPIDDDTKMTLQLNYFYKLRSLGLYIKIKFKVYLWMMSGITYIKSGDFLSKLTKLS